MLDAKRAWARSTKAYKYLEAFANYLYLAAGPYRGVAMGNLLDIHIEAQYIQSIDGIRLHSLRLTDHKVSARINPIRSTREVQLTLEMM